MPTTPEEIALARSEAIAALEAELTGAVTQAQRVMYEGLLSQLQQTYDDPMVIPRLLTEYQTAVAAPLAQYFAQQVLRLPALNVAYFEALNVRGYQALRAPLSGFLEKKFGVTAAGEVVPGGYLSTLVGDTTAQRELLKYAYTSQASGAGISAYRKGLQELVTGGNGAKGLMEKLYAESGDTFAEADRSLQGIAAERLKLTCFLYQGGLIKSSRPFCVKRNGKVFTGAEIDLFGTKNDTYDGYTKKSEGLFSGKSDPYQPRINLGGHSCRHNLHALPDSVALTFRPDLMLNDAGELVKR